MSDIAIGAPIEAWPAAVFEQETTAQTSISSTSPTSGSPVLDFTFTSPSTGRVILVIGGGFRGTSNRCWLFPEVFEGSSAAGTLIAGQSELDIHAVGGNVDVDQYAHWSRRSLLEGLTPDVTHYVRARHFVSGGSDADIRNRELAVIPAP